MKIKEYLNKFGIYLIIFSTVIGSIFCGIAIIRNDVNYLTIVFFPTIFCQCVGFCIIAIKKD